MTFDQWWSGYWKANDMQPVFNAAMREIASAAWKAARTPDNKEPDPLLTVDWVKWYRNATGCLLKEASDEHKRRFQK